jgi:hypothetical protein
VSVKFNVISGAAAITLAVLFPIYWVYIIAGAGALSSNAGQLITTEFSTLNAWDLLFVVIGLLEITVYIGLYKVCRDQIDTGVAAILLVLMSAIIAVFHATVLIDVLLATGVVSTSIDAWIAWGTTISISLLFLYTIVAGVFAIVLLVSFSELNNIMKAFAIGLLLMCVLQLTVVLASANIVIFPVLLVLLAIQFFRNDHKIDIV